MQYHTGLSRRLLNIILVITIILSMVIQSGSFTAMAASKLKVTPGNKTIYTGEEYTLTADRDVKWSISSGKTRIKLVSRDADSVTVKGVKAGTAYVKAKAGKISKKIKITVKKGIVPSKINLVCTQDILGVGNSCTAYVKSVEPSNAVKDVIISSSDEEIATINSEGTVTGVAAGTVTITAASKIRSDIKETVTIRVVNTLKGTVNMTAGLTDEEKYPQGAKTEIWVPVPKADDNQKVSNGTIQCKAPAASESKLTTDSQGNRAMHIVWDENVEPKDRTAKISYHVNRIELVRRDDLEDREQGSVDTSKYAAYLAATERSGSISSGIVRDTAEEIVQTAEAESVYQKAQAIFAWVTDNLSLDKNADGIGTSDVPYILNHKSEKYGYSDINETLTALLRAEGIPARCIYGIRLDSLMNYPNRADIQNCKVEFYLPGYGWVITDAAAPLKIVVGHENRYRGEKAVYTRQWNELLSKHWGAAGEGWVQLAQGENIELSPQAGETLKYFVYPYAEYDGAKISDLSYKYSFTEDPEDCGCD